MASAFCISLFCFSVCFGNYLLLEYSSFKHCVSFYCTEKWTIHMYTYIPFFFGFPSHSGYHGALNCISLKNEIIHLFICLRVFFFFKKIVCSYIPIFLLGFWSLFSSSEFFKKFFFPYSFILRNNQHGINSTCLEYTIFEL